MRLKTAQISILKLITAIVVLVGCDSKPGPPPVPQPGVHVLSTVYPLSDITKNVGGDHATLDWLVESGGQLGTIDATEPIRRRRAQSNVVVTRGPIDHWAEEGSIDPSRLIRVSELTGAAHLPAGCAWLNPQVAIDLAQALATSMSVIDPKNESEYRQNAEQYSADLKKLDTEFHSTLASMKGRKFISVRPIFGPMLAPYGLSEIAPLDVDPTDLSDADLQTLKETARRQGATILLIDVATLPGVQQRLADGTGLKLLALDPLGSSASAGRSTYIKLMEYNLSQLRDSAQ